jgi:O-antigen/teichoic acid export membrane protein
MGTPSEMLVDLGETTPGHRSARHRLTSGRVLARNAAWSLVGQVAPMLVAVVAIPPLIGGLGRDRFGVLTLAWLVIGYFSLFDLGLGRALTKVVAERLGAGREGELPALVWTSLGLMMALGLAGAALVGLLAPWLVRGVIKVPAGLQPEAGRCVALLAVSIPFVISGAGLRGVLEAQQQFGAINVANVLMGSFTFIGPLLVLPVSRGLVPAVAVLLAGRVAMWVVCLTLCLRSLPALREGIVLQGAAVRPLLHLGGWMTVTNIVGPLMVSLDRVLIGVRISVGAVAYYATPYEVVTKLWILPGALVRVLFPAFATSFARDPERTASLFDRGVKLTFLALFPITLVIVRLADDGLRLWLGADFARHGTRALQWLAIGVFLNSLGMIPFALIQGVGRPDLTAKLHLIELPFYLPAAWVLIGRLGIEGAAIAWVVRVAVDTALLFALARWAVPGRPGAHRLAGYAVAAALPAALLAIPASGVGGRGLVAALALGVFALSAWFGVLSADERSGLRGRLTRPADCRN